MSGSHDKLPKLFWIQLALAAFIGVMYLITPAANQHEANASETSPLEQSAAKNLESIGKVAVISDKAEASGASRSGEQIFNSVCGTCHKTGIANAPKIDDKEAWEPRLVNGLQGLIDTATKGKGAMPPNGGDPAITAEELKNTILYMTKKAGVELSSNDTKAAKQEEKMASTTAPEKEQPPVVETISSEKKVAIPPAPVAPAAPTAPEPAKEKSAPVEPVVAAASPTVTSQSAVTKTNDLELGKKIYTSSCFACHDTGVAGSPKIGDQAAWSARIAAGTEALYTSALNGKGVMPAKGGNTSIADNDVKAAVDYMISMSK